MNEGFWYEESPCVCMYSFVGVCDSGIMAEAFSKVYRPGPCRSRIGLQDDGVMWCKCTSTGDLNERC